MNISYETARQLIRDDVSWTLGLPSAENLAKRLEDAKKFGVDLNNGMRLVKGWEAGTEMVLLLPWATCLGRASAATCVDLFPRSGAEANSFPYDEQRFEAR